MKSRILFILSFVVLSSSVVQAAIEPVVNGEHGASPAINDSREIVFRSDAAGLYGLEGLYSTQRGLIAETVDASSFGISNSGEVVYLDILTGTTAQLTSTVRGPLFPPASGGESAPRISSTTGEIVYKSASPGANVFSTLQGQIESFDRSQYSVGLADVNDLGEVVFMLRDHLNEPERIYSSVRGYISRPGIPANRPSINDLGEVVWSGQDSGGRPQIFSSVRGQLTFFGGGNSFLSADQPDINNLGDVVFRGFSEDGPPQLYLLTNVPEPGVLSLGVIIATAGTAFRFRMPRSKSS